MRQDACAAWAAGVLVCLAGLSEANVRAEEGPDASAEGGAMEAPSTVAGWIDDEGFVLMSSDEAFKLQLGFTGAYRFEPLLVEGDWQDRRTFYVMRPYLGGNVLQSWIRYFLEVELAATPPYLLQAFVDVAPWDALGVRVGQFGTPFSRHESFAANALLFPDWAVTANYFWSGFDKGAALFGQVADETLDWWVGAFGGSPLRQFTTLTGNYVVLARLTYSPLGPIGPTEFPYIVGPEDDPAPWRISFTANAWYGRVQLAEGNFNPGTFQVTAVPTGETNRNLTVGADIFLQSERFVVFGEGYWRRLDPDNAPEFDSWGVWGQAGVLLVPRALDVGVRVNYLDPSTDLDEDTFRSVEAQVGWYVWKEHLTLKARYGIGEQESPGEDALGPVPLAVPAVGTIHVFTLQGMLAF